MPKILFRPAPTPPPFVPPTPSYDTLVKAKSNPFPIEGGYVFSIIFEPANLPTFDRILIFGGYEELEYSETIGQISMTNADFGISKTGDGVSNSDEYPYLSVNIYNGDSIVHVAKLELTSL